MQNRSITILWTDDEIDLLKPYILFLEEKGYHVITASNGDDAISLASENDIDLVFLDENMPGRSGLQTLDSLKLILPNVPVVMITKSEEEDIMEQAIGSKIADYLIKPVNPKQILLSIKKNTENRRLVAEKTNSAYQSEFMNIGQQIGAARDWRDWMEIHRKLTYWELEISTSQGNDMAEVFRMQKADANNAFSKYIKSHYESWFNPSETNKPLLSPNIIRNVVLPQLDSSKKTVLIVIDNLRYDQWLTILPMVLEFCKIENDDLYYSILPTATQYARNAIFAGLMPLEIEKLYPQYWVYDEEDEGKNQYEEELLRTQLQRMKKDVKFKFEKVYTQKAGKRLVENITDLNNYDLTVAVYSFVDMLSHARTDMEMIRELASDEAAYRSLTSSWFEHSHLHEFMKECAAHNMKIIVTTDHGTTNVSNPIKVIGDRSTSTNLRYKAGKNLNYNPKEVYEIKRPEKVHLPLGNLSSAYIFATNNDFMVYPNNYNQFVNYYRNTFQHGGISLEEMIIPLVVLAPR